MVSSNRRQRSLQFHYGQEPCKGPVSGRHKSGFQVATKAPMDYQGPLERNLVGGEVPNARGKHSILAIVSAFRWLYAWTRT